MIGGGQMKFLNKFILKRSTFISMIILTILCLLFCIICSYYLNIDTQNNDNVLDISITTLKTIKDILIILTTILGTNLFMSLLIDVRSKNQIVTDIIENDVIASPEFYEKMSEENKLKMCNALERKLHYKYIKEQEIFNEIREKLKGNIDAYYYESCEYVVSCNIYDTYIEKQITRKVAIKSFDSNYTIKGFSISKISSKSINGIEPFKLELFKINDKKVDLEHDVELKPCEEADNLDEQNEYDINNRYIYKKPINIFSDEETTITVKCISRTSIDDKGASFRVAKPCHNFSLIYTLQQYDKYRLSVHAFGFLDDADDSANNSSKSNINITFDNWIFENDGVVVIILDK